MLHVVNLFLELFGECEVFSKTLTALGGAIRRLNWQVLPTGKYPWAVLKQEVDKVLVTRPPGSRVVIENRLEAIRREQPEFLAVGRAGFSGYLVFGFPAKELFVLESTLEDNATYVFGDDWEALAKMTKAEILSEDKQKDRIIHREGWENRIGALLKAKRA